jgi:hypothetical protein
LRLNHPKRRRSVVRSADMLRFLGITCYERHTASCNHFDNNPRTRSVVCFF